MPLSIGHSFEQDSEQITIRTDRFKGGLNAAKLDVSVSDLAVKINYPQCLEWIDLYSEVDELKAQVTVADEVVTICIPKKVPGVTWPAMEYKCQSKEEVQARRQASCDRATERLRQIDREKELAKHEMHRAAVKAQMEAQEGERQRLLAAKHAETEEAERDLLEWQRRVAASTDSLAQQSNTTTTSTTTTTSLSSPPTPAAVAPPVPFSPSEPSSSSSGCEKSNAIFDAPPVLQDLSEARTLPAVRCSAPLKISFTTKKEVLPERMPARDPTDYVPVRLAKFSADPDQDETTLKQKGDQFYQREDFASAINAYTAAIAVNDSNYGLYSNRAACHLRLGAAASCVADASQAIALWERAPGAPKASLSRMLSRRAAALSSLSRFDEAIADFNSALTLDPDNKLLQEDLDRVLQARQTRFSGISTPPKRREPGKVKRRNRLRSLSSDSEPGDPITPPSTPPLGPSAPPKPLVSVLKKPASPLNSAGTVANSATTTLPDQMPP